MENKGKVSHLPPDITGSFASSVSPWMMSSQSCSFLVNYLTCWQCEQQVFHGILLPQEFIPIFLWTLESGRRMWQHGGTVSHENSSQPLPPRFLKCHKTKSVTEILGMRAYWSAKPHPIPVLWTTSLLATHPGWGIMSVFYLPLAPLASAFIVVEGVTVLVHRVVGQVHETLVLCTNRQ